MTPKATYFDMEGITLIHGDCMEQMKTLEDKSIDCVITDPPYESEAHTQQRRVKRGGGVMEVEALDFTPMNVESRSRAANEIARVARRWVLTFCQVEAAPLWRKVYEDSGLVYKRTCIWVKPDGMPQYSGDRPGMGYETILAMHTPGRSEWNGGGMHGVWTVNKNDNGGRKAPHPTTKPRQLMINLVSLFSNVGETVLDPFMGSGTTGVACAQTGRVFIGMELDKRYFEIAKKRIEGAQLPLLI